MRWLRDEGGHIRLWNQGATGSLPVVGSDRCCCSWPPRRHRGVGWGISVIPCARQLTQGGGAPGGGGTSSGAHCRGEGSERSGGRGAARPRPQQADGDVGPPGGAAEGGLLAAASARGYASGRLTARSGGSGAAANEGGRRGRGIGCGFVPRCLRRTVPMRGARPARPAPRPRYGAGRSPAGWRVLPVVVRVRPATNSGRRNAASLRCQPGVSARRPAPRSRTSRAGCIAAARATPPASRRLSTLRSPRAPGPAPSSCSVSPTP